MKLKTIIEAIEGLAPLAHQDEWDNSGLQVAAPQDNAENALDNTINSILICLDVTEEILDEAIESGAELIVSHHPLIFRGLKEVSDRKYQERCVIKAIRHGICIYSAHTSLDNSLGGVNHRIADILGLKNLRWLDSNVPANCPATDSLSNSAAPNNLGNSAAPNSLSNGAAPSNLSNSAVPSDLSNSAVPGSRGVGLIGELAEPVETQTFLAQVKSKFSVKALKHSAISSAKIRTVALCGGAGAFMKDKAAEAGADCFICGEFHYHDWFDPGTMLIEIGHYQSEQYTQDLLVEYLSSRFPSLSIRRTSRFTDPELWLI